MVSAADEVSVREGVCTAPLQLRKLEIEVWQASDRKFDALPRNVQFPDISVEEIGFLEQLRAAGW